MISSPSRSAVSGVCSAGFNTQVQPDCERRRELPSGHHERKVPRDDLRDDADGLAARERVDAAAFRPADRDLDRRAFDFRGPAGHVAEVVHRAGHVDHARHELRLAVVEALELRELVCVFLDQIRETPEQRFARGGQHRGPRAGLERGARGGYGPVDIRGVRVGDGRDLGAGRGVDHRDAHARLRVDPLAADQKTTRPTQKGADAR